MTLSIVSSVNLLLLGRANAVVHEALPALCLNLEAIEVVHLFIQQVFFESP